jgi:hypothetical protein
MKIEFSIEDYQQIAEHLAAQLFARLEEIALLSKERAATASAIIEQFGCSSSVLTAYCKRGLPHFHKESTGASGGTRMYFASTVRRWLEDGQPRDFYCEVCNKSES